MEATIDRAEAALQAAIGSEQESNEEAKLVKVLERTARIGNAHDRLRALKRLVQLLPTADNKDTLWLAVSNYPESSEEEKSHALSMLKLAATERQHAAAERQHAAAEREHAAAEREHAAAERAAEAQMQLERERQRWLSGYETEVNRPVGIRRESPNMSASSLAYMRRSTVAQELDRIRSPGFNYVNFEAHTLELMFNGMVLPEVDAPAEWTTKNFESECNPKHGSNCMQSWMFDVLKHQFETRRRYVLHDFHDVPLPAVGGRKPDLVVSRNFTTPTETTLVTLIELKLKIWHNIRENEMQVLETGYEALLRCPTRPFIICFLTDLRLVRIYKMRLNEHGFQVVGYVESARVWDILIGLSTLSEDTLGAPRGNLGEFTLGRWLGSGATSAVWSAKRDGDSSGDWFLKVFKQNVSQNVIDTEYETLCLTGLQDVGAYDVGYFKSERRVIFGKPVCCIVKQMTPILWVQLIRALMAVHKAGHVHRDVRPPNFSLVDPNGKLRLLDFGFAVPDDGHPRAYSGNIELAADEVLEQCMKREHVIAKPEHDLESAVKCYVVMRHKETWEAVWAGARLSFKDAWDANIAWQRFRKSMSVQEITETDALLSAARNANYVDLIRQFGPHDSST